MRECRVKSLNVHGLDADVDVLEVRSGVRREYTFKLFLSYAAAIVSKRQQTLVGPPSKLVSTVCAPQRS